jgi:hypothetical protein
VPASYRIKTEYKWSRDGSVGIEIMLRAEQSKNRGSIPGKSKQFSPFYSVQAGSGAHTAGFHGLFSPGIKRSGREVDYSPRSSADLNYVQNYTSIAPYNVVHWDNFAFRS